MSLPVPRRQFGRNKEVYVALGMCVFLAYPVLFDCVPFLQSLVVQQIKIGSPREPSATQCLEGQWPHPSECLESDKPITLGISHWRAEDRSQTWSCQKQTRGLWLFSTTSLWSLLVHASESASLAYIVYSDFVQSSEILFSLQLTWM